MAFDLFNQASSSNLIEYALEELQSSMSILISLKELLLQMNTTENQFSFSHSGNIHNLNNHISSKRGADEEYYMKIGI